ncbi:MAG: hypothetical protein DI629_08300 [Mesorhizobium amorphae]|nr:MAG: hypothetical protein DI629_08300 [Mesorhizobium amorphae]
MQSLGVVPRLFPLILSGEKRSTIRWKEAPIVPGPMLYVCDGAPEQTALVEVWRVSSMPLQEAARFLGREKDWPDPVMLEGMREHYPLIGLDEIVDVIEHHPFSSRPA